jgi:hypothetical protein
MKSNWCDNEWYKVNMFLILTNLAMATMLLYELEDTWCISSYWVNRICFHNRHHLADCRAQLHDNNAKFWIVIEMSDLHTCYESYEMQYEDEWDKLLQRSYLLLKAVNEIMSGNIFYFSDSNDVLNGKNKRE